MEGAQAAQTCNCRAFGELLKTDHTFAPDQRAVRWEAINEIPRRVLYSSASIPFKALLDMCFLIRGGSEIAQILPAYRASMTIRINKAVNRGCLLRQTYSAKSLTTELASRLLPGTLSRSASTTMPFKPVRSCPGTDALALSSS